MKVFFPRLLLLILLCAALCAGLGISPAYAAPLVVQGGTGDDGTGGGVGADGSDYTNTNSGTSFDSITVTGGSGGNGGGGNQGGKGGDVDQTLDAATVSTGSITVTGGTGGNTGSAGGSAGDEGGDATLTSSAGTTVTSTGAVSVSSGADGAAGSWSGIPKLSVLGTLIAPSVTLGNSLNNGDAWISVQTLDVGGVDTALASIGSLTGGNFSIFDANLAGGHQLSITAGEISITNLNVSGSGRLFVADGAKLSLLNLHADTAKLTFVLPAALSAGDTFVTVYQNGLAEGVANLTGTTIGLDYHTVRPNLAVGEGFTLLSAQIALNTDITTLTVQTPNGDVYTLSVSGNDLLAVLSSLSPTGPAYERLKAYAEGRAANLAFVNQGQDLILNQGFGAALAATSGQGLRMNAFGGAGGGSSRYKTGSHVDVSGFSLLAGLAVGNDAGPGRLTLGAFFEGGWGSYDSHNSFSNAASVKGDGDTSYFGGGFLGRYDLTNGALSGLYFDASARMGRARADFNTDDIKYNGSDADFDTASLYYGLHGGLGYIWNITSVASLDFSARLLWTRQEGDSVSVHGDHVRFKDADSLRSRLGGRFNYAVCEYATPYVGAYWEHEFDGKARSSVNGVGIGSPSLKGSTGVGELGLTLKPSQTLPLSFDLGVQGYAGVREGVTGSLQIKYEF